MSSTFARNALAAGVLVVLGALVLPGCGKKAGGLLFPNQPPTVELTNAPVSPDRSTPYFYAYRVNWSGQDPDGLIDHYEYCIDPTSTDSVWIKTKKNEEIIFFRASQPDSVIGTKPPTASDFHVFVIKAVDNLGAESPRKFRAFFSFTVAPTVQILNPAPTKSLFASVSPSVQIEWTGSDPDGQFSQKPVKYKFKLLDLADPVNARYRQFPDSLRIHEAARNFVGWDSTSADTQFVQFTNLTPDKQYLFALIGFDEAGAYSPVFDLNSNLLQLAVGKASSLGPRIHIFNQFIDFTYDSGGYTTDPLREIPVEIPTHVKITVNWDAIPTQGSRIQYFRWMVDGNINDNTQRTDELNDYIHWSQPSPTMPNLTVLRGFENGDHRFYLECADNNTQKSLGILKMTAVTPTFDHELLVIDDTRLELDKFGSNGCPLRYTKPWPSRAEMDTFMFARGNFPWHCTRNPTTGVLSPPGLLAGYKFDTLGTRLNLENPANGVLLSKIGQYRNLIWLVDGEGGGYIESLDQTVFPVTALKSMCSPGRASTLAAYTQLGGRVWMAGGGAGYASLRGFDKVTNNQGQTTVFSSAPQFNELVPSRIMYDGAHWQSTMGVTSSSIQTFRYDFTLDTLRRLPGGVLDTVRHVPFTVLRRAWSQPDAYNLPNTLSSPDYSKLPPEMRWKSPDTDPMPPTRDAFQTQSYYQTSYPCEYILENNSIIEDVDPDPDNTHEQTVLDTLYRGQGVVLLVAPDRVDGFHKAPEMTYYHGNQAHQFVFSGFAPWGYARQDCIGLVDFVLHDIWGLDRQAIDRGSVAPAIRSRGSSPVRIVTPAQRTVSVRVPSGTVRE
ncbi:MAG TPA: hypothetical protein VI504_12925 [Candidatus Eisenbacteria bacterium]|jgi:hypothetical protein